MPRNPAFALVLCFGLAATPLASAADAPLTLTPPSDGTLLSVSAEAEASRAPDVANLSAGVVTQAADANSAMRANAALMAKVMAAVRAAGVPGRDVQTSGISLNPQYRYGEGQAPAITGYQASNSVNVRVRDIARLGQVIDALVASGANQVNGPSFEIDEPEAVQDEARRLALDKARQRAEMYAKALGLRVRRIVSISEGGGSAPPMPMMMKAMAMDQQEATPVAPGESTLRAGVDVVFDLGR